MAEDDTGLIGRRIRAVRASAGWTLKVVADRAQMSPSYLSELERGLKPVDSRARLLKIAEALEVTESRLTDGRPSPPPTNQNQRIVSAMRLALLQAEIDEPVDVSVRPWPQVAADVATLNAARPRADFALMADVLPALVMDLHAHLPGPARREALAGLVDAYSATRTAVKALGKPDLAQLAARYVSDTARVLSGPEWHGLAAWQRVHAISQTARDRAWAIAVHSANDISGDLDHGPTAQAYGSLHLVASLAAMTLGKPDTAMDHVAEATEVARTAGVVGPGHGRLWFSSAQVAIWETTLRVEQGDPGRALEVASGIDPTQMPDSPSRQSSWWVDIGRAYSMKRQPEKAIRAFERAERLAPQRLRSDKFAQEIVTSMMVRSRRDAVGKAVRGMAHRMALGA